MTEVVRMPAAPGNAPSREGSRITRKPDTMSGAYCLAGTRMPVTQVKRMLADAGRDWIKSEFPWITDDQISAAMNFRARRQEG